MPTLLRNLELSLLITDVQVTIPVTLAPEGPIVPIPAPVIPDVPLKFKAILVTGYSSIYTIDHSLPDGIVTVLLAAIAIGPALIAFLPASIE